MNIEDVIAKAEGNISVLDKIKGNALTSIPSTFFLEDFNKLLVSSKVILADEESALSQLPATVEVVDPNFDISNKTPTYLDILCLSKQILNILQNYEVPPMGLRG